MTGTEWNRRRRRRNGNLFTYKRNSLLWLFWTEGQGESVLVREVAVATVGKELLLAVIVGGQLNRWKGLQWMEWRGRQVN